MSNTNEMIKILQSRLNGRRQVPGQVKIPKGLIQIPNAEVTEPEPYYENGDQNGYENEDENKGELLPGNNANSLEKRAYWISGHGVDPTSGETFTVPGGCTIVVKATPGESTYIPEKVLRTLCKSNPTKLKNPLHYIPYIIKQFGSVIIYKEGEECPNFEYTLKNCLPGEINNVKDNYALCSEFGSGVMDIDRISKFKSNHCRDYNIDTSSINCITDVIDTILSFYKNSVYPTIEDLEQIISEDAKYLLTLRGTYIDLQKRVFETIDPYTYIKQKDLCNKLSGVYYNFVCRYRPKVSDKVYSNPNFPNNNPHQQILNKNVKNSNAFELLRERIGEAELKRKKLLQEAKFGEIKPVKESQKLSQLQVLSGKRGKNVLESPKRNEQLINKEAAKKIRNLPVGENWLEQQLHVLPTWLKANFLFDQILYHDKSDKEPILHLINTINHTNFEPSIANPTEKYNNIHSKNDIINFTIEKPIYHASVEYPIGSTPLWVAVKNNYLEFIEPLLKAGAKADITVGGVKLYDISSPEAKAILDKYRGGGRYRRKSLKKRKSKSKKSKTKKRV
jgi:hypothetical protein